MAARVALLALLGALAIPAQASGQVVSPVDVPLAPGVPVGSPGTRVLIIDQDQVVLSSDFGQRVRREVEADFVELTEENRRIEAELIEEEQRLTALRTTMAPEEFRGLADAFDARVVAIRAEQDAKTRALSQREDEAFSRLLIAAQPVFEALLAEYGAELILDRRVVFFASGRVDITAQAIERINAFLGEDVPELGDLPDDADPVGLPLEAGLPERP